MKTSRRKLLAGMAGVIAAPQAAAAFTAGSEVASMTVAEERYARLIAAAQAPDTGCAWKTERYADVHWPEYVAAARAVLAART